MKDIIYSTAILYFNTNMFIKLPKFGFILQSSDDIFVFQQVRCVALNEQSFASSLGKLLSVSLYQMLSDV